MLKSISRAVPVAMLPALLAAALVGQTLTAGKAAVLGTGSFTSFVENMDRSLAFYHDAFGMEVPALPESGQRPYNQQIRSCSNFSIFRERKNVISPRESQAPASPWS